MLNYTFLNKIRIHENKKKERRERKKEKKRREGARDGGKESYSLNKM